MTGSLASVFDHITPLLERPGTATEVSKKTLFSTYCTLTLNIVNHFVRVNIVPTI
jgi:hypothetical protein